MQVGNFMDNLSAVQIATANRPLFMISFNSNSSLFRVSVNCVNTCYFFVICSFSPKKHHYKEKLRDGTNLSTMTEHPVPNAVTPRRFNCIYIYHVKSRLNTPVWGSLRSPNYMLYCLTIMLCSTEKQYFEILV